MSQSLKGRGTYADLIKGLRSAYDQVLQIGIGTRKRNGSLPNEANFSNAFVKSESCDC